MFMKMEKSGLLSDLLKIWRNGQVKASLTVEASISVSYKQLTLPTILRV